MPLFIEEDEGRSGCNYSILGKIGNLLGFDHENMAILPNIYDFFIYVLVISPPMFIDVCYVGFLGNRFIIE